MTLKNNKGIERNVRILFEFYQENNKYIIYEDYNTGNIYGGKKDKNYLKALNEEEYGLLNNMYKKMIKD